MRSTNYVFERRELGIIPWIPFTRDIVSEDGAHYHCWIPKELSTTERATAFSRFKHAARGIGDPVSFSWDLIPGEYRYEEKRIQTDNYYEAANVFIGEPLFIMGIEMNNSYDMFVAFKEQYANHANTVDSL